MCVCRCLVLILNLYDFEISFKKLTYVILFRCVVDIFFLLCDLAGLVIAQMINAMHIVRNKQKKSVCLL